MMNAMGDRTQRNEFNHAGHVLVFEREMVEITSSAPRRDKAWRHVDSNGHEHRLIDGEWPTLRWVKGETYFCESCNDEHTEGHWECAVCGEHVEPGMRSAPSYREFMPGLSSWQLDGETIDPDEADRLLVAWGMKP